MNEQEYLDLRASRMAGSVFDNPIRKHEAQGIGCGLPIESELILELKAFVLDCASPDHYAHSLPLEVVVRAGRIKNMMAAARGERPSGVGYQEPPPARCEACDSE